VNSNDNTGTPVAIIGVGCLFPGAATVEAYWANIVNRVDAIGDVPPSHWRADDYFHADPGSGDTTYARRGGFLSPVDFPLLDFGVAPNTLEAVDSTQLLGLLVASQALEDAGYGTGKPFDRRRTSVILGVTGTLPLVIPLGARLGHPLWRRALAEAGVAEDIAERVVQRIADGYVDWQEHSFPGLLGNVVAGRIANRLDLGGTNCVVDAACASSLSALHLGLCELTSGRTDMVLTGGMDCFNDIFMYVCFSKTLALSQSGNARPFDATGDGTILGEGLGCLVLKRLADAERDGDTIYAVIRGVGSSSDGKGQAIYAPSPAGQVRALRQAYELTGVTPATIELVEAHGTGTRAGDTAEVAALNEVYGTTPTSRCAIGSVKSQIGHTKAAAGAAGLIKAALALHHKVLPPTINVTQPIDPLLPGRSAFYVNTEARPWLERSEHPRRAGVSSFGFGGSNFHCVLEEYGPRKRDISWDGATQIVALGATSVAALQSVVMSWPASDGSLTASTTPCSWDEIRTAAAHSRASFSRDAQWRLIVVLEKDKTDLARPLARVSELLAKHQEQASWTTPEGIYFGSGEAPGGLAMLFPGQGSQYVGMLRAVACQFPSMLAALSEADAVFGERARGERLSDFIYPTAVFTAEETARNDASLRAVDIAQPALGAVSAGALRVLSDFGVRPDATAGHSYGELVALHAAGRLDAASLHRLSNTRGRLMADRRGDAGGMLAVHTSVATVEHVLREQSIDLCIANRNAPNQTVLSGRTSEIQRAAAMFAERDIRSSQIAVAAAFHSPLMAHASERFATELEGVVLSPGEVPVFSNTTADAYPEDSEHAKELLAKQLAAPVTFSDEIDRLYRRGIRTFLEVGPGNKLTGLVGAILGGQEHAAIALDASSGKRSGVVDLARTLAALAALGHSVALDRWEPPGKTRTQPTKGGGLTVSICGANYVRPRPASKQVEERAGNPLRLSEALRVTQENLLALQKFGEQTARLHAQFLENQNRTLEVFQGLMDQQQRMLQGGVALPAVMPAAVPRFDPVSPPVSTRSPQDGRHDPVSVDIGAAPPAPVIRPPSAPASAGEPQPVDQTTVAQTLLAIVAEKTGYPHEVLRLDMELDADLGIDSIKRVEIFSAFQEKRPDTPPVTPQHIGTLRTLQNVVDFYMQEHRARSSAARVAPVARAERDLPVEAIAAAPASSSTAGHVKRFVLTKQPLAPNVVRSAVAIDRNAEIWVSADDTDVAERIVDRLRALGFQARVIALDHGDSLSQPVALAGLVVVASRRSSGDDRLRKAFRLLQCVGPALRTSARSAGALFCTVARLDGAFGLTGLTAHANLVSGGLAGLVKTAALEWPGVRCKAFDLAEDVDAPDGAAAIVDEMLSAGDAEVGITRERRWRLELLERPLAGPEAAAPETNRQHPSPLRRGDLVVISGGARGVTAEIAVALAHAHGVSPVLLGRSSEPRPEPDWLAPLTEESEIKKALAARAGQSVTPRELGDEYHRLIASREIRRTLKRLEAAGVNARYCSVDVRDEQAVKSALASVPSSLGPVRGLVHGAGVLADRSIDQKTLADFESVYSTKVGGLRSLLASVRLDELRLLALFSSSAGRFGRAGQADYAVANEVLNKTAWQLGAQLPDCRVISFNWGPWDGGMVTPALKRVFQSEGMGVIAPQDGAAFFLRELGTPARDIEVVALAGEPPTGGTMSASPEAPAAERFTLSFERELTVDRFPVLRSHVLAHRAVVPTVLALEWLAHGALHTNPGLVFHGFNDLRVLKGIRLAEKATYRIRALAAKATKHDSEYHVPVELHGASDDSSVLHLRATIVLTSRRPEAPDRPHLVFAPYSRDTTTIYRDLLFHGPDLRGLVGVDGLSEEGASATAYGAPPPAAWIQKPLRSTWLADPLALDAAFQLMTLWSHEHRGAFSLPTFVGHYRQFRHSFPRELRLIAQIKQQHAHRAVSNVWFVDADGLTIAVMQNYECVMDPSLGQAFRENRLRAEAVPSA
jgi:acyl transferase domain-containing protein